jgi:uncharacterized membrane protein (UPF0127 family)
VLEHQLGAFRRFGCLILAGLALAGGAACAQAPAPPAAALGKGCVDDGPPQRGLPIDVLTIMTDRGARQVRLQVADDYPTREKGLMFVRRMAPDEGMIFDFHSQQPVSFWMHNTYIGLDMLFVDAEGRVARVVRNAKPCDDTSIASVFPVRTVIELNAGAADALGVKVGDRVTSRIVYPAKR